MKKIYEAPQIERVIFIQEEVLFDSATSNGILSGSDAPPVSIGQQKPIW